MDLSLSYFSSLSLSPLPSQVISKQCRYRLLNAIKKEDFLKILLSGAPVTTESRLSRMRGIERGETRLFWRQPRRWSSQKKTRLFAISASFPWQILQPIEESGSLLPEIDVLLLFLPGALTPPDAYIPLVQAIQKAALGLRLWVAILNFTGNFPTSFEIEERYKGIRTQLKILGFRDGPMPSSNVVFAGHSLGAYEGRISALVHAQGFIQMGSWFNPELDNLSEYPKPVLTIAGEYDGQMGLPMFGKHFGDVARQAQLGEAFLLKNKPIVVIRGMNHSQFSHGIPNTERGDLPALIPIDKARREVAEVVAKFIILQFLGKETKEKETKVEEAKDFIKSQVMESGKLLRPFSEALNCQKEGWEHLQENLVEKTGLPSAVSRFQVEILWPTFPDNFFFSNPWIDMDQGKIFCHAKLVPQGKFKLSSNLWIKMKSTQGIKAAVLSSKDDNSRSNLSSSGEPWTFVNENRENKCFVESWEELGVASGEKVSCEEEGNCEVIEVNAGSNTKFAADVNEKIFNQALEACDEAVRSRYEVSGKKIWYLEDKVSSSLMDWMDTDVQFTPLNYDLTVICVQSPVLVTPVDGPHSEYSGMHYIKVWTAARAMDWIMMDSVQMSSK